MDIKNWEEIRLAVLIFLKDNDTFGLVEYIKNNGDFENENEITNKAMMFSARYRSLVFQREKKLIAEDTYIVSVNRIIYSLFVFINDGSYTDEINLELGGRADEDIFLNKSMRSNNSIYSMLNVVFSLQLIILILLVYILFR